MTRTNARPQQGGWLAPLAVCLAAGAGLGCLSFVKWGGGPDLAAYLEKMAYGGRFRLFFSLLFRQLAYLVPLFLCGYFRRGLGAAALLFGVKGFFAARLAAAFLHAYGGKGYAALMAACFLQSFCSVFCMLLLGCRTMKLCADRRTIPRGRRRFLRPPADPSYDAAGVACFLLCLGCSLAGCLLTPSLSRAALALIS
ncbi:MAG: hypothetical protein HFE80_08360 [Clostridiaceae bacterium]|jgi:hypothetical protein|nr:hypothetical protein [Clostridiaceae bacterium]